MSLRKNRKTFFYAYFIMKFPKVCRDETNVEARPAAIESETERARESASARESAAEKAFCKITLKTKMHYCHLKCKHALSCHRSFESLLFVLPSRLFLELACFGFCLSYFFVRTAVTFII